MPEGNDNAFAGEILNQLGLMVLVRAPTGAGFRIASAIPDWWEIWFGSVETFLERSAFVEDFVSGEAAAFWGETPDGDGGLLRSGWWEETAPGGDSRFFEAIACRRGAGEGDLLLIQPAEERFSRERAILQSVHDQRLDRRRLQKELEKKQILLECIMHDLGNPLATVLMTLQHLDRQLGQCSDLLPAVTRAIAQAERQRSLIRSIAEVFAADLIGASARIGGGSGRGDLVSVATQTVSTLTPLAAQKSLTWCPLIEEVDPVAADPYHLGRVIENLLVNAIRHSPEGGKVMVSVGQEGARISCRIEDEGAGIGAELANRLFRPFSQGSENVGQSGLGLYFCRLALEQWGGGITACNRPEGGACFEFHLPNAGPEREVDIP